MEEGPRKDEFLKLAYEYKGVLIQWMTVHEKQHHCLGAAGIDALKEAGFAEFWPAAEKLIGQCPNQKARPAPAPPTRPQRPGDKRPK
jgi:hypothetical protein